MTIQARAWVFTLNNPSSNDIPRGWNTTYAVWQLEKSESGTLHLQGYAYFKGRRRFGSLKALCAGAHWEPRKGSHTQAKAYCTKIDTRVEGPWEIGSPPKQGSRSDLAAVRLAIRDGRSPLYIADNHWRPWILYRRSFQAYRLLLQESIVRGKPEILLVYGPSGLGKTRTVRDAFPKAYWLKRPEGKTLWFDGYAGQRTVIVDEFFSWISYHQMKRLLDYGHAKVKVHGGLVKMLATRWIFTSNKQPGAWYPNIRDPSDALNRRFREFATVLYIGPQGWIWQKPDQVGL